jgi:hypothetical protein
LLSRMLTRQTVVLNRLAEGRKDLLAFHRFFNNEKVDTRKLIESITHDCSKRVEGRELLCIQDTSEYNYQHHVERIKEGELGPTGNDKDIGFFAHPMLVLDAEQEVCLGFSHLEVWHRSFDKQDKNARGYKGLPIEEKESYRWLSSCEKSKRRLDRSSHITFIADREADIYELWERIPDEHTDLIIRCRTDRKLYQEDQTLFDKVSSQPALGSYRFMVKENPRKGRSKHEAELEVRSVKAKINRPAKVKGQYSDYLELTVVEAREKDNTVKTGEPPVHWYLLTTKSVNTFEEGRAVISDYSKRWQIEQLFRISKHQGLDMEASQMETGKALMNLCVMALQVAMKVLQLTQMRDGPTEVPVELAFTKEQVSVLEKVESKYEGNTEKQKNPHVKYTLSWAAWIIARLGGWKGYRSQSTPGPITFHRGLLEFDRFFLAWQFLKHEDV